jgi:hypothetical protein
MIRQSSNYDISPCSYSPPRADRWLRLDQLHPLQTRMPILADDDVIVHGNAEWRRDIDDGFGHPDVGLRGRRIAGGVIVHDPALLE